MLQAIVSYCACMMSDGYRIRAASLLYGSFFKNRTICTSCSFLIKGRCFIFASSEFASLCASSLLVHLHSPMRMCFLSSDSATTSSSAISPSLFSSVKIFPHHREAILYAIPSMRLPLTYWRHRCSQQSPTYPENCAFMMDKTVSVRPSSKMDL